MIASGGRPPHVLVVDDDAKIVTLVAAYLERAGYRVSGAHDGLEALRQIREHEFDAVVLDVMLPGVDGVGVARIVREESARPVPILMLTALSAVPDRVRGLEAGADDYLAKPFAPTELVARIRSLLRRARPPAPPQVLHLDDLELDPDRRTVRRGGTVVDLTSMEFCLLAALLAAEGRVLTRTALMSALEVDLRNGDEPILERSIDAYVGRLRAKLGDDARRPRYIDTVRGVGYRTAVDG